MSDELVFIDEDEEDTSSEAPWHILVVDDEPDVHTVTAYALEGMVIDQRPIVIHNAYSAAEAQTLLATLEDLALVLLDVVMEADHAGLDVVNHIRNVLGNQTIRIVLRTGHPGQFVERDVYLKYDINGYHVKSEMTSDKLFSTMVGALRSYQQLVDIQREKSQRQQAEKASSAKSNFVANMSHELRTPFTAILGYIDILMEELEDLEEEDLMGLAKRIQMAAKAQLHLINNVLDISKIEAGAIQLQLGSVLLESLFFEVRSTLEPLAEARGLKLRFECSPSDLKMWVDAVKIRQCLINLGSNGIKFTDQGEVLFQASVSQIDGQAWIHFKVTDTGAGMDEAQVQRLFVPYQQGEKTSGYTPGTGLGLVISKHFCEVMGGTIEVSSKPGEGSCFHVYLPQTVVC